MWQPDNRAKTQYDVVIVGAGPAGASAARSLVKEGYRVLIVEKKKMPRYKICSGLITDRSQDLLKQLYGQIPEEILCHPKTLKGTRICLSKDKLITVPMKKHQYNTWRSDFDNWLIEQSGAEVWDNHRLIDFNQTREHVQITLLNPAREKIFLKASYLIGADGGGSRIRRLIDPDFLKGVEWVNSSQVYCKARINLKPDYYYMFFDPSLTSFYTWLSFKDDLLVYGVGSRRGGHVAPYLDNTTRYLEKYFDLEIRETVLRTGCISTDMGLRGNFILGRDRVLLAGEAAGFLNVFGEGISSALGTGHAAALAIHKAVTSKAPVLPIYTEVSATERRYTADSWGMGRMIMGRDFLEEKEAKEPA